MGVMIGGEQGKQATLDGIVEFAQTLERQGFDNVWMANIFGHDAISTLSIVGRETSRIGLGTAVVPSFPRHPTAMAQQVMTASAACRGRFTLGLGLSHKWVVEAMMGLSYEKPARHMREYLQVLLPLLRKGSVKHQGEVFNVDMQLAAPDCESVPVVIAALGPIMLKVAGQLADGTITWMTGLKTLESYIIPSLHQAAGEAGRAVTGEGAPRVVAGLPFALVDDVPKARTSIDQAMAVYGQLPSYRAMLDKEGAKGPGDVAVLGNELVLRAQLRRLRLMGVTDFNAFILPLDDRCVERTLAFLAEEMKSSA
jgi:F420-dependent oxidoreductase-like protein